MYQLKNGQWKLSKTEKLETNFKAILITIEKTIKDFSDPSDMMCYLATELYEQGFISESDYNKVWKL